MISIIVPVYNGEKYIENIFKALDKQILRDFEVIFINDGSTDNTQKLLIENKIKYDYDVKVYEQKNAGVSAARNKGLDYAEGEYICFVDIDDDLRENYLSLMYEEVQKRNGELIFCESTTKNTLNRTNELKVKEYSSFDGLMAYLNGEFTSGVWTLMVKNTVIKENKLRFAEGYKYSEDLHMVWRLIDNVEKIILINEPLYIYNTNEGSAMSKFNKDRMHSIYLMDDLNDYFKHNNPEFYNYFMKYGKERIRWSVIWQAAHYLGYNDFKRYIKENSINSKLINMEKFKDYRVRLSSKVFNKSEFIFYLLVKISTQKIRKV